LAADSAGKWALSYIHKYGAELSGWVPVAPALGIGVDSPQAHVQEKVDK
jgi:hypothetical protein